MRTLLTAVLMILATQAWSASITLRYWNGTHAAQISGLSSVKECEKLAKQKRLSGRHYYCVVTGKKFDKNFERQNGWKK
jgi:hypothetical protein